MGGANKIIGINLATLGDWFLTISKVVGMLGEVMWQIGIGYGDGLQIHDFCNGKKYSLFNHDILYYYVKTWIIITHDYVILNAFQV